MNTCMSKSVLAMSLELYYGAKHVALIQLLYQLRVRASFHHHLFVYCNYLAVGA